MKDDNRLGAAKRWLFAASGLALIHCTSPSPEGSAAPSGTPPASSSPARSASTDAASATGVATSAAPPPAASSSLATPPAPTSAQASGSTAVASSPPHPRGTEAPAAGVQCGGKSCKAGEQCCTGMPFRSPTCFKGPICPISRRDWKKDIAYLTEAEADELAEQLLAFKLARYHYKAEDGHVAPHLGFIIDDVEPSPAVGGNGDTVDLYAYTTMAVLALKKQDRTIRALEKELADLRREVDDLKGKR